MKQKEYVFSEYDRAFPLTMIGTAFMQLFILTCSVMVLGSSWNNLTTILIIWVSLAIVLILIPTVFLLKDSTARTARYEFVGDSVHVKIGRKDRWLKSTDYVCIAVKSFIWGDRKAPIEKPYYLLWKEGIEINEDLSKLFRTLRKNEIIMLPYDEGVRQKLCALFGDRKELLQDVDTQKHMEYVFSDGQRLLVRFSASASLFSYLFLLSGFVIIYFNYKGEQDFILNIIIWSVICIFVHAILSNAFRSIKYRFIRYEFSEDAVSLWVNEEKRCICTSDDFRVSLRTLELMGGRYSVSRTKYIVLWKSNEPEPKDMVSAYYLVKHYQIIVLPDTEEIRNQLKKTFDIKVIGYWVTSPQHIQEDRLA